MSKISKKEASFYMHSIFVRFIHTHTTRFANYNLYHDTTIMSLLNY